MAANLTSQQFDHLRRTIKSTVAEVCTTPKAEGLPINANSIIEVMVDRLNNHNLTNTATTTMAPPFPTVANANKSLFQLIVELCLDSVQQAYVAAVANNKFVEQSAAYSTTYCEDNSKLTHTNIKKIIDITIIGMTVSAAAKSIQAICMGVSGSRNIDASNMRTELDKLQQQMRQGTLPKDIFDEIENKLKITPLATKEQQALETKITNSINNNLKRKADYKDNGDTINKTEQEELKKAQAEITKDQQDRSKIKPSEKQELQDLKSKLHTANEELQNLSTSTTPEDQKVAQDNVNKYHTEYQNANTRIQKAQQERSQENDDDRKKLKAVTDKYAAQRAPLKTQYDAENVTFDKEVAEHPLEYARSAQALEAKKQKAVDDLIIEQKKLPTSLTVKIVALNMQDADIYSQIEISNTSNGTSIVNANLNDYVKNEKSLGDGGTGTVMQVQKRNVNNSDTCDQNAVKTMNTFDLQYNHEVADSSTIDVERSIFDQHDIIARRNAQHPKQIDIFYRDTNGIVQKHVLVYKTKNNVPKDNTELEKALQSPDSEIGKLETVDGHAIVGDAVASSLVLKDIKALQTARVNKINTSNKINAEIVKADEEHQECKTEVDHIRMQSATKMMEKLQAKEAELLGSSTKWRIGDIGSDFVNNLVQQGTNAWHQALSAYISAKIANLQTIVQTNQAISSNEQSQQQELMQLVGQWQQLLSQLLQGAY